MTRLIDEQAKAIELKPRRTPDTRASLLLYANFARDHALLLARLLSVRLEGIDKLDELLRNREKALTAESQVSDRGG